MKTNQPKTKVDPSEVARLAAEGMSQATIAAALGVSRQRVNQICTRDGIETLFGGTDYDAMDKIAVMHARGMFTAEIAEALGETPMAVLVTLRRMGKTPHHAYNRERVDLVKRLADQGFSQTEAANAIGIAQPSISRHAKKHSIKFADGRSRRFAK
ncbi:MAG: hypothetical protein OEZ19_00860 [Paracoccaceae bacterium]|nr:hypothetical protein [Paracoccaceae bacterium]